MVEGAGEKKAAQAVWGASPAGTTFGGGAEPGTREFFERVLRMRSSHEQPWLSALVPFASARGRRVLELGCGAGYDAYAFCRAGAEYVGIDITPENPGRTRRHLGHFDLAPRVLVADAEALPFREASFDVVFSNGVLHHTPDIERSFRESARVLRRGGEFWVILYHRNSVVYRVNLFLVNHLLKLGFRRMSLRERLAKIEYTTSTELPLVNVYSRGELRNLLTGAGFTVDGLWVRKLVPEDLPFTRALGGVWRRVPQRWLDAVGSRFGWYVIARAVRK